jgi:ATP/maltotriose-dependent transcriptional regulator MalT
VYFYTLRGEGASLLPRLLEMKQRVSWSGDRFALVKVKQWLTLASLQAGQLRQAYRESQEGLALLEHLKGHAYLTGYFSIPLARVCFEWNQLDEARALLHQAIADATVWQQIDRIMWGYMYLVELEIAAGNLLAASKVLQEEPFRRLEEQGLYQFWRTSGQVCLWLAEGNMAEANAWAAHIVLSPVDWTPPQARGVLTLLRVYLAEQQYSQALEILEAFREYIDRPGNIEDTIAFLSLYAIALHLAGEQECARVAVLRLLTLTRPEGYVRVYLGMGTPMRQLLQSLLETAPDQETAPLPGSYVSTLLAAFEKEERQRAMRQQTLPPASAREQASPAPPPTSLSGFASEQPVLLEPLTAQEQRVLRLLAAGLSTQAMAQTLVVSRNTVKTHLRNLYGKLQANSRTQALALARDLQLL